MRTRSVPILITCMFVGTAYAAKPQDPITPWAEAHASVVSGSEPLEVDFSARGSFDPDSGVLTYSWDFGDGTIGAGVDTQHVYSSPGFYVAVLTVTDSQGLFDQSSKEIRVAQGNSAPIADAGPDQSVSSGDLVIVDGSTSTDPDGGALSYSWTFIAVPPGSTPQFNNSQVLSPSFLASAEGVYVVRLVVNDGALIDTDDLTVIANP